MSINSDFWAAEITAILYNICYINLRNSVGYAYQYNIFEEQHGITGVQLDVMSELAQQALAIDPLG